MITKITSGTRELALTGRWDTEESVPYGGARTIRLRGSFLGAGPNARAMLKTAQAEFMGAVDLCSHSGGQVVLHSYMGDVEIRMPARYLGAKQIGDRATAQAGCTVELEFQCLSRYWQGATVSTTASLASGTCQLVMANEGTARARPAVIIRASWSYNNGTVKLNLDDGRSVTWAGSLYNRNSLVFDMAKRQVYIEYNLPAGPYPVCTAAASLTTAKVTDYDEWLTTVWDMDSEEEVTITTNPASADLTAELIHINEYY